MLIVIAHRAEVKEMWLTEYNEEEVMQQFKDEGREEGIQAIVELCKDLGGSSSDAVEKIVANMHISQTEANRLVSRYW